MLLKAKKIILDSYSVDRCLTSSEGSVREVSKWDHTIPKRKLEEKIISVNVSSSNYVGWLGTYRNKTCHSFVINNSKIWQYLR